MATRLYPATQDPVKLEKLCGVPAGTAVKLKLIEDAHKDSHEELYNTLDLSENSDARTLFDFNLFGWGRMALDRGCTGHTEDTMEMVRILTAQSERLYGLSVLRVIFFSGGLHWS